MRLPKLQFNFYKRCTIALLLFTVFNLWIGQLTDIDLRIEDYYFNFSTHKFDWNHTWFAKQLMHGYVKYVITDIGRLLILVVVLDLIYPWRIISQWLRYRLRFVAIAALIIPAIATMGKHFSALHCPAGVDRYGGLAPFLRLFDAIPNAMQAGHCFPAGHATVGLWLAALCVFWLPHNPKNALAVFLAGLSVGFGFGWVQQMRGEHFLFHTLWSVWIAAFVVLLMLSFCKSLNPSHQSLNSTSV
jgi:membrane-associated PAP2 superfamily phosphatase